MEAYILLFATENYIQTSKVENLIEFAKSFSKDRPAFQGVKIDHTSATYKLREGSSVCELIDKLKKVILALK